MGHIIKQQKKSKPIATNIYGVGDFGLPPNILVFGFGFQSGHSLINAVLLSAHNADLASVLQESQSNFVTDARCAACDESNSAFEKILLESVFHNFRDLE